MNIKPPVNPPAKQIPNGRGKIASIPNIGSLTAKVTNNTTPNDINIFFTHTL